MKKKIRVLHLASFMGNIGDNANHLGSNYLFKKYLPYTFDFTQVEIRSFYRKERFFDSNFVDEINSYDLFIVGGGNFFELWPPNSKSGTSIDFGIDDWREISTPTLFYSLGVDVGQGVPDENKINFKEFLSFTSSSDKFFLSVRNDGAFENIKDLFSGQFLEKIVEIPDGGFFYDLILSSNEFSMFADENMIGINLAGDMGEIRFKQGEEKFVDEFASTMNDILIKHIDKKLVFFNHIPKDLILSAKIINKMNDEFARSRVLQSPYQQGILGAQLMFSIYKRCELILSNRFHANVVPIGMKVPTIGLNNYIQIENLYKELNLRNRTVNISQSGFRENLRDEVSYSLSNKSHIESTYSSVMEELSHKTHNSFQRLIVWMNKHFKVD